MSVNPSIRIADCLWVSSQNTENQHVFSPILRAVERRGIKLWSLKTVAPGDVSRFRERVWKSDEHVILHGLLASELKSIQPIFKDRKNYSIVLIDWWNGPLWFTQNATYAIYHNYNGFTVRLGRDAFLKKGSLPWFVYPERAIYFQLAGAALRFPALATAPFLNLHKWWQRRRDVVDPKKMLYFPFPIAAEDVPLKAEPPRYDFTNMGATMGIWIVRDPYASAWLNFANLYCDRQRLINLLSDFNGQPYAVYDRRRNYNFLPWDEVCTIIRQSRFAVCTGGVHQASIPKFLEYVCLGTPIIGSTLPFEYPWLDQCVYQVDGMHVSHEELKPKLKEALELQPRLREKCLSLRDQLLAQYEAGRLLEMLQGQIDGQGIPPGYLKE